MRPVSSSLSRLLVVAIGCAWGLAPGAAEEPASASLTAFEQGPWARSSLVLLGEVSDYRSLNRSQPEGPGRAQVRVEKVYKGTPPGPVFSLLVAGPRPTLDSSDPSAPYLPPGGGGRYLLFLRQRPGGAANVLEGLVDATGASGEERVASLEAETALLSIPDAAQRAQKTLAHFLGQLKAQGTWSRVHAARELAHMVTRRPDLFDATVRRRIAAVYEGAGPPQQKSFLRKILEYLQRTHGKVTASSEVAATPGADPELVERLRKAVADAGDEPGARRDLLLRFAAEAGPRGASVLLALYRTEPEDVRLLVVTALAESGVRAALPALRASYAREEDADVRGALVRAVGLLGDDTDLPWLTARLENARLKTEVLYALARIRSEAALALLGREAEAARGAPGVEANGDTVRLIDYLRSPDFVKTERAAGRRVGPFPEDSGPPAWAGGGR